MARVRVVGLGPGGPELLTPRTRDLLEGATVARLRTRVHPAAAEFPDVASYDEWYESADSFDALYDRIVDDLESLAVTHPNAEVVYAVPGSPTVAESTVSRLTSRARVEVVCEPAVSVIDVVAARLGRDLMAAGVRIVDALDGVEPLRGPGPLLILQTYSPEVLALLADRLPPDVPVVIVHHVGLPDEQVVPTRSGELSRFAAADHLTSVWVEGLRTAGETMDDLVDFMRRLRAECPWDQEQTHASLARHLMEESYEALDALEAFAALEADDAVTDEASAHLEEELGDVLFQVVFHAQLGEEEGRFSMATIADRVRDKLTERHPHVFGDAVAETADDVARRWEDLKKVEKGRDSVTDGVAWQLPALSLYATLRRKTKSVLPTADATELLATARVALARLDSDETDERAWGDLLEALASAASGRGVDLEGALRQRALALRDEARGREAADGAR